MAASALCKEILWHINISSDIEFALSKKKGIIGHTAITLKFDGIPVFTIDYGQEGGYFGSSGFHVSDIDQLPGSSHQVLGASLMSSAVVGALLMPGSDLRVNGYNISIANVIKSIADFAIDSSEKKQFIKNLLVKIAYIQMGEYSVSNNNCRHFVEKAMDIIESAFERYDKRSISGNRSAIQKIKREDTSKIIGAGVGLAIGIVGLGVLISIAAKAIDSDEDE